MASRSRRMREGLEMATATTALNTPLAAVHLAAGAKMGVSFAMIRERLVEWLDKYIIMDDVTLTDETARYGTLALEGPQAAAMVKDLAGVDLAQLSELASVDAALPRRFFSSVIPHPTGVVLSEVHFSQAGVPAPNDLDDTVRTAPARDAIPCRIVRRSLGGVP